MSNKFKNINNKLTSIPIVQPKTFVKQPEGDRLILNIVIKYNIESENRCIMQGKKKIIRNMLIFIALIIITFMLIFKDYDLKKTIDLIFKVDSKYIILAIITMFLSITFEGLNLRAIIGSLGSKISILNSIKYTLVGFFFSGITPGGGGGQPMEIYYLTKEQIPGTHSTLALLMELCSFHIVTLILGFIGLIANPNLLANGFIWIFIIGTTFKIIVLATILIGLFSRKLSKIIVDWFLKFLKRINYRNIDKMKADVSVALEKYHEGSVFIKEHRSIFLKSLLIVLIQVIANYGVTYFIYRSFGLNKYGFIEIVLIQSLLLVSTSSIPLPGAVGISENAFLTIYLTVFGAEFLASAMLLSRGITFYLFMIISLLVVIYVTIKRKKVIDK